MMREEYKEKLKGLGYKEEDMYEADKLFSIKFPSAEVYGNKLSEDKIKDSICEVTAHIEERLEDFTSLNFGEFLSVIEDQFGVLIELEPESAYKLLRHFVTFMRRPDRKGEKS